MSGDRRSAAQALDEYMAALRATTAFSASAAERYHLGVYRAEVERHMTAMRWRDAGHSSAWMPDANPDGVRPLGSGQWSWGPDGKAMRLHVAGLLYDFGWTDSTGNWWRIEHSLQEREVSVWLGVANNSTRRDIQWDAPDAWPTWAARAALDARGQQ